MSGCGVVLEGRRAPLRADKASQPKNQWLVLERYECQVQVWSVFANPSQSFFVGWVVLGKTED